MTTQTEALKLANSLNELLESFEKDGRFCKSSSIRNEFYDRLKQTLEESREALAQPEQEPEFVTHNVDKPYDWSEWVCPNPSGYLMKCCDCGLVHEAEFGVVRYKSETEREDCDMVDDPNLQAVFRMRRSEKWSPEDTAHRAGGLPMAQPEQEQNLKLMPREATPEMLKAMDECSTEGYDEHLYAGHAASVYMAAWDAFHGQHCYCGDITNLGVIHRDDGPCHYPEHTSEYKRGYADAMNWKVQNHLEHLPAAQPEQEPVAWMYQDKSTHQVSFQKHMKAFVDHSKTSEVPLYGKPLANHELQCVCGAVWCGDEMVHLPNKTPPQPKQDKERCLGCEACIDTACGRDECPKGWTKAPQRTWVGLTDKENAEFVKTMERGNFLVAIYDIEKKIKGKNT